MPVFGNYEIIGWFISSRPGRGYWRVINRELNDGRVYFVKTIALPGPDSSQDEPTDGSPVTDPGADFIESVTRLQEASRAHGDFLAPIHEFGRTKTQLWYATDLYPRHSLAEWHTSAAEIDHPTLEHVVYSVASGCLALQQATGRSHGNLKTGNVLLAGEPGPLRGTPIRLIDPAGLAFENAYGPADGNVRDATERCDLRAMGALILELVEGYPLDGAEDYTLPIKTSEPWKALGKHSQRWLKLCNRLLDPDLSLDLLSLKSLAKDLRPRSARTSVFRTGMSLAAVLGLGAAAYLFWAQPVDVFTKLPHVDIPRITSFSRQTLSTWASRLEGFTEKLRMAFVPAQTDARIESGDGNPPSRSPGLAEGQVPTAESPASTRAPGLGAPPPSATGSATSKSEPINSKDTEATPQTSGSESSNSAGPSAALDPQESGLASKGEATIAGPDHLQGSQPATNLPTTPREAAPLSTNPGGVGERTNSGAQFVDPGPVRSVPSEQREARTEASDAVRLAEQPGARLRSHPEIANASNRQTPTTGRERVLAQPSEQRVARANRPESTRPAAQAARTLPDQAPMARNGPGDGRTLSRVESPRQPPVTDVAALDAQLRELEASVSKAVALRRNSELFDRVEALEAQYGKANQLSGKIKKRFDFLRVNMAKKVPGPPPERQRTESYLPPIISKPPPR